MENRIWQWHFEIKGLIPDQVKLKRKVWLKRGELFLEKKGDKLQAFLLGEDKYPYNESEKILSYLRFSCLISGNAPDLEDKGGIGLKSITDFGKKKKFYNTSSRIVLPKEAVAEIENHAHKFIGFIGNIHNKYIDIVSNNDFIAVALDYYYEAEKKFVYSNEGFISAVISMEALFNEGPSDIKYKLSHRAAFLLGLSGMNSIEAFEKLKDFYNKRSKIVHGGGIIPHDPDRNLISCYTRRLIIIFLILLKSKKRREISKKDKKVEILREIDHAMLNKNICDNLKREIDKGLKDFKLSIPRTFEGKGEYGEYIVTAW